MPTPSILTTMCAVVLLLAVQACTVTVTPQPPVTGRVVQTSRGYVFVPQHAVVAPHAPQGSPPPSVAAQGASVHHVARAIFGIIYRGRTYEAMLKDYHDILRHYGIRSYEDRDAVLKAYKTLPENTHNIPLAADMWNTAHPAAPTPPPPPVRNVDSTGPSTSPADVLFRPSPEVIENPLDDAIVPK